MIGEIKSVGNLSGYEVKVLVGGERTSGSRQIALIDSIQPLLPSRPVLWTCLPFLPASVSATAEVKTAPLTLSMNSLYPLVFRASQ
jgi:hypothetical protein